MGVRRRWPALFGLAIVLAAFGWATFALIRARQPDQPAITAAVSTPSPTSTSPSATDIPEFDGLRALELVEAQLAFGPRTPGSRGHAAMQAWARDELDRAGWQVEVQEGVQGGQAFQNLVARRSTLTEEAPWVILGAHYDTRFESDRDPEPEKRGTPVPGANDGASGVAVLMELARALPAESPMDIWIVLFDSEDNGGFEGWDWILGSRGFVQALPQLAPDRKPDAVVVVDMVGDADLNIFLERNSDPALSGQIWDTAASLGYGEQFIRQPKYAMIDDHRPFLQAGIPAVLLIDFDYPHWHTTGDTLDKVSAESLQAVGETLLAWLLSGRIEGGSP